MIRSWEIVLPLARPLSANDRVGWRARAGQVANLRGNTRLLARNVHHIPRCERIAVCLHVHPRVTRRRDGDNCMPTVKAAVDGLCDAGVIADDDTSHVLHVAPVYHPADGQRMRVVLHVTELEAAS